MSLSVLSSLLRPHCCRCLSVLPCSLSSPSGQRRLPWSNIPTAAELVSRAPEPMQKYLRIMRIDKPTGTMLLFWPSAWSIALASPGFPSPALLALFGAGALSMRASACVINDILDKDFDRQVERTKMRPLASGEMSVPQAIVLLSGLLSTSLAILLQLKWASVIIGASSMLLVVGYPLAKRYTNWPQIALGATLNWGVLIAWSHLLPPSEWLRAIPLYAATVLYTVIYDTIYSHQDKSDDLLIGVKSTALHLGDKTKPYMSAFAGAATLSLGCAGLAAGQTWPFYTALAGTSAHLFWQVLSVRLDDASDCWSKFKTNQWLGAVLFTGIVMGNLLRKEKTEEKSEAEGISEEEAR